MQQIEVKRIKVGHNPRKDFGDLTELAASIKEKGIMTPLQLNKDNELIDGHRRLKVARDQNMVKVPYLVLDNLTDEASKTEAKLIKGMLRKNLNPIEEAEAFDKYIKKTESLSVVLAKILGKKAEYIQRRLQLLKLEPEVRTALVKKKIQLGHAVLMSRMDKKRQKEALKDVVEYGTGVADMTEILESEDYIDLDHAAFDKKQCQGCPNNGNEQTLLVEVGNDVKGSCLDPKCFRMRTGQWKKEEIIKLEKKGITVMKIDKLKDLKGASEIPTWNSTEYNKAVKDLEKKPDEYAVAFVDNYSGIPEKQIWRLKPKKENKKVNTDQAADKLNLSSLEKLNTNVGIYKRDLLIEKGKELLKPGDKAFAFALWFVVDHFDLTYNRDQAKRAKEFFKMDKKDLNKCLAESIEPAFEHLDDEVLKVVCDEVGFEMSEQFVMNEDFLSLHTKAQLLELAKEFKIDVKAAKKNPEIIAAILARWKKGQVPKILKK